MLSTCTRRACTGNCKDIKYIFQRGQTDYLRVAARAGAVAAVGVLGDLDSLFQRYQVRLQTYKNIGTTHRKHFDSTNV